MPVHETVPTGILKYRKDAPSPILALAIHAGHEIRTELQPNSAPTEALRLYEEDPHTERLLSPYPVAVWTDVSRFEVDLNRPVETSVYLNADMCWGITPWHEPLPKEHLERSYARHQEAMALLDALVDEAVEKFGICVVLDFHSYNHQRQGPVPEWWVDMTKPAINLGTRDTHARFRPHLDRIQAELAKVCWEGRPVTVGENVIFKGGYVHGRLQARHPDKVLCPSIEFKKIFMDENSGHLDEAGFHAFVRDINAALAVALESL